MAKKEKKKESLIADDATFGMLLDAVRKKVGDKANLFCLKEGSPVKPVEVIPTGLISLDRALGVWGFPRGRIVEIWGPESAGKSTLSLIIIAQAQRLFPDKAALLVDLEHSFDPIWARIIGVDTDSLVVCQPDSAEVAGDVTDSLIGTGRFSVAVIDSVAVFTPQSDLDGQMADNSMGVQARIMGKFLRKVTPIAAATNTLTVFLNQTRQKIGVMYGNPETTCGGMSLKFFATQRLRVNVAEQIKSDDEVIGVLIKVDIKKNKIAPPFRVANIPLLFSSGFSRERCTADACIEAGIIEGKTHYRFEDKSWHGKAQIYSALRKDEVLLERLESLYKNKYSSLVAEVEEDEYESDEDSKESVDSTEFDDTI